MLGTPRVIVYPQTSGARRLPRGDRGAAVRLGAGQAATLDAVWTVSRTKDGKSRTGRTTLREPAQDRATTRWSRRTAARSRA